MPTATAPAPAYVPPLPTDERDIWRISVERYERMVASGLITPDDRVELLEGILVPKMSKSPPHRIANGKVRHAVEAILPPGWFVDVQEPIALDDSQPEPDATVIRGRTEDYPTRHPGPADIALLVEVADSNLRRDRETKSRVYARNGIAVYWIVNVADREVVVYTDPSGPAAAPAYATSATYRPGDAVPVVVAGAAAGTIPVSDLLP